MTTTALSGEAATAAAAATMPRRLVAISHKMYFTQSRSLAWATELAQLMGGLPARGPWSDQLDIVVFPTFTAIPATIETLGPLGVLVGGQDCAPSILGAQTGEVAANVLRELGCTYVEIGHAERRASGEGDDVIRAKLATAQAAGLRPLLCVGETDPTNMRAEVTGQIRRALGQSSAGTIDIAYEPVWAIGAAEAAPRHHTLRAAGVIRQAARDAGVVARVIYGGTAGPGTFADLCAENADDPIGGVFVGRRGHDPSAFLAILAEAAATEQATAGRAAPESVATDHSTPAPPTPAPPTPAPPTPAPPTPEPATPGPPCP